MCLNFGSKNYFHYISIDLVRRHSGGQRFTHNLLWLTTGYSVLHVIIRRYVVNPTNVNVLSSPLQRVLNIAAVRTVSTQLAKYSHPYTTRRRKSFRKQSAFSVNYSVELIHIY